MAPWILPLALLGPAQSTDRDSEFDIDWLPAAIEIEDRTLLVDLEADSNAYANGTIFQVQFFAIENRLAWAASAIEPARPELPARWLSIQVRGGGLRARTSLPVAERYEAVVNFTPEDNPDPRIRRWMAREYRPRIHRWEFRAARPAHVAPALASDAAAIRSYSDRFAAFAAEYRAWLDPRVRNVSEEDLAPWQQRLNALDQEARLFVKQAVLRGCSRSVAALAPSYRVAVTVPRFVLWDANSPAPGEVEWIPVAFSENGAFMTSEGLAAISLKLDEYLHRETGLWIAAAAAEILQEAPPAEPAAGAAHDPAALEARLRAAQEDAAALALAHQTASASHAYSAWTSVQRPQRADLAGALSGLVTLLADLRAARLQGDRAAAARAAAARDPLAARLEALLHKLRTGQEPD